MNSFCPVWCWTSLNCVVVHMRLRVQILSFYRMWMPILYILIDKSDLHYFSVLWWPLFLHSSIQSSPAWGQQHGCSCCLSNHNILCILSDCGCSGHHTAWTCVTCHLLWDHAHAYGLYLPGTMARTHCQGNISHLVVSSHWFGCTMPLLWL